MSINPLLQHKVNKKQIRKQYYDDGKIKSIVYRIDTIYNTIIYYKTGAIACEHYYNNHLKTHGLAYGQYRNGQLAKQIYFQNGIAIYGNYFKKSGLKKEMTQKQLEARNHKD